MTNRQKLFLEEYLKSSNATESAKKAGYSKRTAYSIGQRLLKNVEIKQAVADRLAEKTMAANEVLERLTEHARNDAAQYTKIGADGKPYIDVGAMIADGKQHLIKGISYTKAGDVVVELPDPKSALDSIGRYHKLFTDKTEFSGDAAAPIILKVVYGADGQSPPTAPTTI